MFKLPKLSKLTSQTYLSLLLMLFLTPLTSWGQANLNITKTAYHHGNNNVVNFMVVVTNSGNAAATNVTVTDNLSADWTYSHGANDYRTSYGTATWNSGTRVITWSIPYIAPNGGVAILIFNTGYTFPGWHAPPSNVHNNTVNISSPYSGSSVSSTTPLNQERNLSVTITPPGNTSPQLEENVTFVLTASNVNGNESRAKVTFKLPPGFEYVSHSGDGTYNSADGVWSISSIGAWNTQTRALSVTAKTKATPAPADGYKVAAAITEVVMSSGGSPTYIDPDISNNIGTLILTPQLAAADMQVTKTVNISNPNLGSDVIFTVQAKNNGPDTATSVVVNDLLPAGYEYQSHTTTTSGYNPTTGIWNIGSLTNNTTETLQVTAKVISGSNLVNTATVTASVSDPNNANNSASESVTPILPSADLRVSVDMNNYEPSPNQNVIFTITAQNLGPHNTSGVKVTNQLPAGFSYVSSSPSVGSYNNLTGIWHIGSFANGAAATLQITAQMQATGPYTNMVTITQGGNDPSSGNNSDEITPTNVCSGCTDMITGGTITVNSGQVFCLYSGSWSGGVRLNGGTICIAEGATFSPSYIIDNNSLNGTIINRGTMNFNINNNATNNTIIINYGQYNTTQIQNLSGRIENYGTINNSGGTTFSTGASMINTGIFTSSTFQNFSGELNNNGTMTISGNYSLLTGSNTNNLGTINFNSSGSVAGMIDNSGTMSFAAGAQINGVLTNYKTMRFNENLDIYANTYITNDDLLEFINITSTINFQGPMFTNNGRLVVTGSNGSLGMNSPISQLHNNGTIIASGSIFHNVAGAKVVNNCSIECATYVVGNGTSENNGLILTTGPTNSFQINGGPSYLINGAGAHIQGSGFTNSGYISGYGTFYFTGYTNNQNDHGPESFKGNDPNNPILFYDSSPTGPIFDATNGSTNVVRPPALEGYITTYSSISQYTCTAPHSTAGYPPTTRPVNINFCEPQSISFDLDNDGTPTPYAQPHSPVEGNNFTLLVSSIRLFDPNDQNNPGNNTTSLSIAGKGTLTVNTTNGVVTFIPNPAFTNGDTFEAEYRIWNQWSGTPPMHPSARTKITISIYDEISDMVVVSGNSPLCSSETMTFSITAPNNAISGVWASSNPLVATVDNNGVVTGISTGNTVISYTATFPSYPSGETCEMKVEEAVIVNNCGCYKDPNSELANTNTITGISSLSSPSKSWPESIPNGFLALESKNKGFVITRVQNENAITEPKEGMLIYDIQAGCVKLHNGAVWKCIQKKCD